MYARQTLALGQEGASRLSHAAVLVVGMCGVGAETAKNLVLSGFRLVAVHDDDTTQPEDLSAQFLLAEDDVGKPRGSASVRRLAQLSVSTAVEALSGPLTADVLRRFSVVVATRGSHAVLVALDAQCRAVGVPFVAASARGFCGYVFCDFGPSYVVHDARARPPATYFVESVTQACPAAVLLSDESRHALDDGDEVEFVGLDGMDELALGGPRAVSVTGTNTFLIPDDARTYGVFGSGYCRELPRRRTVAFRSLAEELPHPTLSSTAGAASAFHAAFRALDAQEALAAGAQALQEPPSLWQTPQEPAVPPCDDQGAPAELRQTLLRAPRSEVCPVAAVIGAFAAAEALKAGSGVYLPLCQWLYIDLSEAAAPATATSGAETLDGHAAAYGTETLAALAALRVLIAGAGGIAGEMLKNLALLGVGRAAFGGSITVADDQTVTVSNLSRGVLLRSTDIGRSKAEAVSERAAAVGLRPSVHHVLSRVTGDSTCALLSDEALAQFGVLAAAVNSFSSRLLLDERCVRARLPWVDAGVDGPLAYVQPVVPFASVPWSAGARDRPAREAPSCVLRNFPYLPWHTVDWARAQFDAHFCAMPSEVNAYLGKRDYLDSLFKKPAATRLHALRALGESLVHHRPLSLQACIAWARAAFDELFFNAPHALLSAFPPSATAPDGSAFWHGSKRTPTPLQFSADDELHFGFLVAAANLHAEVYGLKGSSDAAFFRSQLATLPTAAAGTPKASAIAGATDAAMEDAAAVAACEEALAALPPPSSLAGFRLAVLQYEVDDSTHGDFIAAASALRASCYRIPPQDALVARLAAGGVPSALQPAAALAGGLLALEICKQAARPKLPLAAFRCRFASLADPCVVAMQPTAVTTARVCGAGGRTLEWSLWDRIEMDARGMTLADVLAQLQETLGLKPSMLSYGKCLIYADFLAPVKRTERLGMSVVQLVESVAKTALPAGCKQVVFSVSASDEQDEDVEVPDLCVTIMA